jgi:hypothetical protein
MPKLLRTVSDEPPALIAFLSRIEWQYGHITVRAIWKRTLRIWNVTIGNQCVAQLPTISHLNQWWRDNADELRAGIIPERQIDVTDMIIEARVREIQSPLPPELARLRTPITSD